jgi:hypothetical protein
MVVLVGGSGECAGTACHASQAGGVIAWLGREQAGARRRRSASVRARLTPLWHLTV